MSRRSIASVAAGGLATIFVALLAAASAGAVRTTTVPPPKAAKGSLRLYLPDAFFVKGNAVTLPKRLVTVGGQVRPFVAGQFVTVRAFVNGKLFRTDRLRIKPSRNRAYGRFTEIIHAPRVGRVTVAVRHDRTAELQGFQSRRSFAALDTNISWGSTGRMVQLIQQRLAALHFYIPQTGVYDGGTGLAVDAYHRLLGWGTYQTLDGATISWLLAGIGKFNVRYPGHGRHAEANLGNQLLALINNGGKVYWILPVSSGKPSTPTVTGNFQVYRRDPGYLPDGMYFSSFFYGGYAIHGYDPAPDYPASHGCLRLPIPDAIDVFNWLDYGVGVDVY
jgi:hypothetical protein